MKEVWVEAKGFPDYLVSNHGHILDGRAGEILEPLLTKGRLVVCLVNDSVDYSVLVHRLVAGSFFDVELEGKVVRHIDGNVSNNAVWNLEVTDREIISPRKALRLQNLDTGEIYESTRQAGQRLGLTSAVYIPPRARDRGEVFRSGGYRLKLV